MLWLSRFQRNLVGYRWVQVDPAQVLVLCCSDPLMQRSFKKRRLLGGDCSLQTFVPGRHHKQSDPFPPSFVSLEAGLT